MKTHVNSLLRFNCYFAPHETLVYQFTPIEGNPPLANPYKRTGRSRFFEKLKAAMGRSCSVSLLLILAILCVSLSPGMGRNIKVMSFKSGAPTRLLHEEKLALKERETVEYAVTMDYTQPGPNTNPRAGGLFPSPPPGPHH